MDKKNINIENVLQTVADMQSFSNVQDSLTRVITETLSKISIDNNELNESDLELVRAAALSNYQQFYKKYGGSL